MKHGELIHVPVTITPEDHKLTYHDKKISWWSDNALIPYDSVLMSAYFAMGRVDHREDMECRDDVLFFGDSGGFQLLSMGEKDPKRKAKLEAKLNPRNIIKWQQDVCDIGMTLDVPLPRHNENPYTEAKFQSYLKTSTQNGNLMRELHENKNLQLFDCLHGKNLEDLTQWYKTTTQEHEFDGFSLSSSTVIKKLLPLRLGFAMEHFEGKPFHILGVSAPQLVLLMAYANKYAKSTIYFDSSSASLGRMYRKYVNFYDIAGGGIQLVEEHEKYENMKRFTCPCPVCSELDDISDLWKKKTLSGAMISLHNLYWMVNFTEFVNELVHDEEAFTSFIRRNCQPWILESMEFLDMVHEQGLEDAYMKHFSKNTQKLGSWY